MNKPKGGRGKVAPYEQTHMRVPLPIKEKLQKQIDEYRTSVLNGSLSEGESDNEPAPAPDVSFDEAIAIASKILREKKSARISIAKLLTALYGEEVKPADLNQE